MSVDVSAGHQPLGDHSDGGAPPKILLLTDDPDVRSRIEGWLAGRFRFHTDGKDVAAVLDAATSSDVVVVDATDGLDADLASRLRDGGFGGSIVFLTDAEPDPRIERMPDADAVVSPASRDDLTGVVRRLIRRRRFRELVSCDFETTALLSKLKVGTVDVDALHGLEVGTLLERNVRTRAALREVETSFDVTDYAAILREGVGQYSSTPAGTDSR